MHAAGFLHLPQRFSMIPPLQPDELLSSWVLRIGAYYGLGNEWPQLLIQGLAPHLDHPVVGARAAFFLDIKPPATALARLAGFTGLTVEELRGHSLVAASPPDVAWHYAGIRSIWGEACPSSPGYCLACLADMKHRPAGMYLRQCWALTYRTVCPIHLLRLEAFGWIGKTTPSFEWRPSSGGHLSIPGGEVDWPVHVRNREAMMALADAEEAIATALCGKTVSFGGHLCRPAELFQVIEDLAGWCGQMPTKSNRPLLYHVAPAAFAMNVPGRETIPSFTADELHELPPDRRQAFLGTVLSFLSPPEIERILHDNFIHPAFPTGLDRLFLRTTREDKIGALFAKTDRWPRSIAIELRKAADRHQRRQEHAEKTGQPLRGAQSPAPKVISQNNGKERDLVIPLCPTPLPKSSGYDRCIAMVDAILAGEAERVSRQRKAGAGFRVNDRRGDPAHGAPENREQVVRSDRIAARPPSGPSQ